MEIKYLAMARELLELRERLAAADRVALRAWEFCEGKCPQFALEIELEAYDIEWLLKELHGQEKEGN